MTDNKNTVRLNRYLAMCGLGARRKVEEFVTDGRVKINGEVVTEPGRQVSASDQVEFEQSHRRHSPPASSLSPANGKVR